jgi:hypothetical protein
LDNTDLSWTTGGNLSWFGQQTTSHDGVDAAQSGAITHSQESWFETTIVGPGTLTYWCKVSSEANFDLLRFYTNGVQQGSSLSGEVDWQQRTVVLPAGTWTCRWRFSKDNIDLDPIGQNAAWVDQVSFVPATGISLAAAVDNPGFTWLTGGFADWFGQSTTTHDGIDAAESGNISDDEYTILQTTVVGPGTISFWWKVSSEVGWDWLHFFIDSSLADPGLSGEVNWTFRSFAIPAGAHTLSWQYSKDDSFTIGQDRGWVDQIVYSTASSFATNSARMTNGQFQFQLNGQIGGSYTLQASTNLTSWAAVTNVVSTNINMLLVDPGATNYGQRFYRIVSP